MTKAESAASRTPRTDALHRRLVKISEGPNWIAGKDYVDMTDHARTLELEAADLRERLAALSAPQPTDGVVVQKLLITGVSKEQARTIVDEMWGSCYWSFNRCYPAEGVTVHYTPALLAAAKETRK